MYDLNEASIIAFTNLVEKLSPYGYNPMNYTTDLWHHTSRKITLALYVDNFSVKYFFQRQISPSNEFSQIPL